MANASCEPTWMRASARSPTVRKSTAADETTRRVRLSRMVTASAAQWHGTSVLRAGKYFCVWSDQTLTCFRAAFVLAGPHRARAGAAHRGLVIGRPPGGQDDARGRPAPCALLRLRAAAC